MKGAIIGGTAFNGPLSVPCRKKVVETRFGKVLLYEQIDAEEPMLFLPRHGDASNRVPPHLVNYKANIEALRQEGVAQVIALYAVGSISSLILPGCYGLIDQFIDFTGGGRDSTFFTGKEEPVRHIPMLEPYNKRLRTLLVKKAHEKGRNISMKGTYICTNGPRLETPAEIRLFRKWGADVVGMTAATETILANEAGIDIAGLAFSINWAAGLDAEGISFVEDEILARMMTEMLSISVDVLSIPVQS